MVVVPHRYSSTGTCTMMMMMMMMMPHCVAFHHIIPLRPALRPSPRCIPFRNNIAVVTTHACSPSPSQTNSNDNNSNNNNTSSFATIRQLSLPLGYTLHDQSLGPVIRVRLLLDETTNNDNNTGATLTGIMLPGSRLHVESFRSSSASSTTGNKTLQSVTPGMCVFIAALALAVDKQAKTVYGLAIDDAPEQHRRLVKYLARFGGSKVRRVDDSVRSVPDRMVYGGYGTIIRGDVASMLHRGKAMIERQSRLGKKKAIDQ